MGLQLWFLFGKVFWLLLACFFTLAALPLRASRPHRIAYMGAAIFFFGTFLASFWDDLPLWALLLSFCVILSGACFLFAGVILTEHQERAAEHTSLDSGEPVDEAIHDRGQTS